MKKKKQHGGARKGAGRPKGEKKIRMWIPESKAQAVKNIIEEK